MIKRYSIRWHWNKDRKMIQTNDMLPNKAAWQHNTPMTDETLLAEAMHEAWRECRSAWDDDDDHPDAPEYFEGFRVLTDAEFLLEAVQDRHYPELGNKVYEV